MSSIARSCDQPYPVVDPVRDVQVSGRVHEKTHWSVQACLGGRATVTAETTAAVAGDGRDGAVRRHPLHPVVARVGDVQVSGRVHEQTVGDVQACLGGRATVTAETTAAVAGDGRDGAVRRHPLHPVVARVGDVQVAGRVHEQTVWVVQACLGGRATVTAETTAAVAGDGRDGAVRRYPPHPVVELVGDVQVAGRVHEQTVWGVEARLGGRATVTAETPGTAAGDGRDRAVRRYPPHTVLARVGDVQVAGRVHEQTPWSCEARLGGGATVTAETLAAVASD